MNPQDQSQPQATPTQPVAPVPQHVNAPSVMPTQPVQAQPVQPAQEQLKVLEVKFEDDLILTVTPETVNDMRFLELYEEVAESEFKIPKLLKFMFGAEAYEGIYKYYEAKGQKFTITKMGEVFEKLDKDLNSNPDFLRQ